MTELKDRVVFITGVSAGIGRAFGKLGCRSIPAAWPFLVNISEVMVMPAHQVLATKVFRHKR